MHDTETHDWGPDEVVSEQEETRVIRVPDWVLFKRFNRDGAPNLEDELYNTTDDPGETTNLAHDPAYAEVLARLSKRIDDFFAIHTNPSADLWQGGKPIQNSMLKGYWRDIWGENWSPVYAYDEA